MEMPSISSTPRMVEDIFKSFSARRSGIVRALTSDVDEFHSLCDPVHYRAWVEKTLFKFEDTWQEQRTFELVLGKEKKEMVGLGIGVASMKSGERALFHVGWELGYGGEGNFSFPNVPPTVDLIIRS